MTRTLETWSLAARESEAAPGANSRTGARPQKILAVDDESEILRLYETFLRHRGYEVATAADADGCLTLLEFMRPDILLLDINMPGIDGLTLLEMVRSDPRYKDLHILMVSARRDAETVRDAAAAGIDGFIVKPFKLKELEARIAQELYVVEEEELRRLFLGRVSPRPSLLRESGLTEFSPVDWDPYLSRSGEQQLCLLVPRGVRPERFGRVDPEELSRRVMAFVRRATRWRRVWPR